jgi:hypothetical protein
VPTRHAVAGVPSEVHLGRPRDRRRVLPPARRGQCRCTDGKGSAAGVEVTLATMLSSKCINSTRVARVGGHLADPPVGAGAVGGRVAVGVGALVGVNLAHGDTTMLTC